MYAFQLGSTVLNGQLLLYIAFGICGYLSLRYWPARVNNDQTRQLQEAAGSAFLLWLAVWKLSPLLIDYESTVSNFGSLLFLDGGAMGQLLAGIAVVVFAVYQANRRGWPLPLLAEGTIRYIAGGTAAYQAALLVIGIDPPLFPALTLGWTIAFATFASLRRRPGSAAGAMPGAVYLIGLALLAFGSEHRLTIILSMSSLQWFCLALAAWIANVSRGEDADGPAKLRRAVVPLLALATIAFSLLYSNIGFTADRSGEQTKGMQTGLRRDEIAPGFELQDLQGNTVRLSDYRGRRVILNFWASWCPPCRAEMPHMQRFYEKHGNEAVLLSVNLTALESSADVAKRFADKRGLTFPIALDAQGDVEDLYEISAYPTTYVLDERGVTDDVIVGPMTFDFMETLLK
ncbi:redoxin domain-containing protein [Cohnella sp. GCM10027633]|uniref:redoxin domain-containing protein n=1 Tax=unclassified Cohnella TaxID=2636738 RepID=UPI003635E0E8